MIKATDFVSNEAKAAAESAALEALFDVFVKEMGADVFSNIKGGLHQWDNPANLNDFKKRLLTSFENGDMVDVASLAMILWNLQQ